MSPCAISIASMDTAIMNPDQTLPAGLSNVHKSLGIDAGYAGRCGMPYVPECSRLLSAGPDAFGRDALVDGKALAAWQRMQQVAERDGVVLQLVSAFRSVEYQKKLIARKLASGQQIDAILCVNAAPGFSEHHSGCALDLGSPDYPCLEESFENSPAFAWLKANAADYGFSMSFPRGNPYGVQYEPWHWCYRKKKTG